MNDYVVITGASKGIGKAVAYSFAKKNYNLILVARGLNELEEIKKEIEEMYEVQVTIIKCDLTEKDDLQKLLSELDKYELYALVNNAGFGYYNPVKTQSMERVNKMLDLNVYALTHLSTFFVSKYQDTSTKKVLVNVSSTGGYINVPNAVAYSASKFYVNSFTEGLAFELRNANSLLEAKVVAPSITKTNFGSIASDKENYDYDKIFEKYNTPEEIAELTMDIIESDKMVAFVNRETYDFELTDNRFEFDSKRLEINKKADM